MKDLANEREAVVRSISEFNFEPVNAESWLPNGNKSWHKIKQELESSHLFVLIVGERYGWIPNKGIGSENGLSVTHMEANLARELLIPVLPFLKKLDYDAPRDTEDAKRRDAFRKELSTWDDGQFITEFSLASDLAEKVSSALVGVLSESYLNTIVKNRSNRIIPLIKPIVEERKAPYIFIDNALIDIIANKRAVLLAGAGMSLAAGLPSARALSELLLKEIREQGHIQFTEASEVQLQEIAEKFALVFGRERLSEVLNKALNVPQGVFPTEAHHLSVRFFKTIVTTNFDSLFESSCRFVGINFDIVEKDAVVLPSDDRTRIVKLHGSISSPDKILITAQDIWNDQNYRTVFWKSLLQVVNTSPIVIVGSSLRDDFFRSLIYARDKHLPGYIVSPTIGSLDKLQYRDVGLNVINADADSFFQALAYAIDE
jgi:hypothetical protein